MYMMQKNVLNQCCNHLRYYFKKKEKFLKHASEAADEETSALMSDFIREQEKAVRMYASLLNK